jgi:7-cyano-7-deazaguanine synthase in queuosine biosynthesis
MAEMITKGKEQVRGKSVLLYSGGMDSLIINYLMKPDVLLNISMNSAYDARERESFPDGEYVFLDNVIDLGRYERDDAIIPNRNAHLVLLASHYGETIWLGSVSGDRSFDKDELFYSHMETLLNHMWQSQHWTEERRFTISSPFKDITKTRLVQEYLYSGGKSESLLKSYSCYEGEELHCGHCKACFRKWVALENNGLITGVEYWQKVPWEAPWLDEVLLQIFNGGYRGLEDTDIIDALEKTPKFLLLDQYRERANHVLRMKEFST